MSNKVIRMLKERERNGERNRIGTDGNSSQKTSIPQSESSVIASETCGWMLGGRSGECVATLGLSLSSASTDLGCFCSLDYGAPQTVAFNGRLRSRHQGIWVASALVFYLQVWQIGGPFPGGTLNCVTKDLWHWSQNTICLQRTLDPSSPQGLKSHFNYSPPP